MKALIRERYWYPYISGDNLTITLCSAVRQACSVFLKNRVIRAWHVDASNPRVDAAPIPEPDRVFIKSHVLALLVTANSRPLRVQVASSLKTIITHDFPENWPTLLDDILTLLNSGDQRSIYGGCFALLELVKSMRQVQFHLDRSLHHFAAANNQKQLDSELRTISCRRSPRNHSPPWSSWARISSRI